MHVGKRTAAHCILMCISHSSIYQPFHPYITWLQRLNRGRICIKLYTNVLNYTFLSKGESRQNSSHRQSFVTSGYQQTATRNLHIFRPIWVQFAAGLSMQYRWIFLSVVEIGAATLLRGLKFLFTSFFLNFCPDMKKIRKITYKNLYWMIVSIKSAQWKPFVT